MGCLTHRRKETTEFSDVSWDLINLNDFKAKSCGPGFAYFWLWVLLITSILVYAVDTFTAVNLLIFDKWSSSIDPGISFNVSKWIFSVCILLSFANLGWEAFRAVRVMKRGNVAECALDPLAVRWESIRFGSGQGYRRFLVFAELTKGKKGAEYLAIFTYFNLHAWIRVLLCSGPRQVVNAFTFKSVYEARLTPDAGNFETSFTGFFDNIKILAEEDYQQALILGAMCFTFVIWVFSFIFLLAAILCYVFFLWHWLPRADGGLRGYCARKVNQRLRQIVTAKVNRALAKGEASRIKAAEKNGEKPPMDSFATLPTLPNVGPVGTTFVAAKPRTDDDLPQMPTIGRDETTTTLPLYSSRPGSIEMGVMNQIRPKPSRTGTMASSAPSYSSRAPLVGGAADMGQGQPASPGLYAGSDAGYSNGGPRMNTPASQGGYGRAPSLRNMPSAGSSLRAPPSDYSRSTPAPRQYDAYGPGYDNRSASPAGGYRDRTPGPPRQQPTRSATGPMPMRGPNQQPHRNMTAPGPPRGPTPAQYTPYDGRAPPPTQGYGRSGTPQGQQRGNPYGYDVESQWDRRY